MAQWLICPYWLSGKQRARDDIDRTYRIDYYGTDVQITNPTDHEGAVDLVFYEMRGDGNFHVSDWANTRWTVPPKYQVSNRVDASRRFGDWFYVFGWFEVWMSLDDMVMDVEIWRISRSIVSGGNELGAGGVVENISQRTIVPIKKRIPITARIPDFFRPPQPPVHFPPEPPRVPAPPGGSTGPPRPGPLPGP